MNIYDALNEYKQYLLIEKKVSDNTLKNYMRDLKHFINYIQKQNQVVLINQIDKDMIRKYLQQFTSLAASSLSRKMVSLRSFYKFLMKEEIVEKNLMETFDLPKNTKRLPQVLNVEEIKTLLDSIEMDNFKNARTRAMLELLYATGMRVSELCNLKLSQLNLKMKYLNVIGKGDKERLLPLNDYVCEILSCYIYDFMQISKRKCRLILFDIHLQLTCMKMVLIYVLFKNYLGIVIFQQPLFILMFQIIKLLMIIINII